MSMDGRIPRIHHVNLPVRHLSTTCDWYCRVLGYTKEREFEQDGQFTGIGLSHSDDHVRVALRWDPDRVKALAGFSPISWAVQTRQNLDDWMEQLRAESIEIHSLQSATTGWLLTLVDPNGLEVKVYTLQV